MLVSVRSGACGAPNFAGTPHKMLAPPRSPFYRNSKAPNCQAPSVPCFGAPYFRGSPYGASVFLLALDSQVVPSPTQTTSY